MEAGVATKKMKQQHQISDLLNANTAHYTVYCSGFRLTIIAMLVNASIIKDNKHIKHKESSERKHLQSLNLFYLVL